MVLGSSTDPGCMLCSRTHATCRLCRLLGRKPPLGCGLVLPPIVNPIPNQKRGGGRRTTKRSAQRRNNGLENVARPLRNRETMFSTTLHCLSAQVDIGNGGVLAAQYVTLGEFPLAAALTSVFDQYKINSVSFQFIPQVVSSFISSGTVATVVPTSVYNTPILTTAVDLDDASAPGTEAIVLSHATAIMHGPFIKPITRTFVPSVALEAYQTGGFGGYSNKSSNQVWLDAATTAVQHYGLKYALQHSLSVGSGLVYMCIYVSANVSFRKTF
jgi:hypothetical protein